MGLVCITAGIVAEVTALALPWARGMSLGTLLTWPMVEANRIPLGLVGAVATLVVAVWVLAGRGSLLVRRALLTVTGFVQFCGLVSLLAMGGDCGAWVFTAGAGTVILGGLLAYRPGSLVQHD